VNSWSSGFYAVQSSETVVCPPPPPPPPPPPRASIFDNDEKSKVASFIIIFEFAAYIWLLFAFSALTLLVGWQEGHPACKKTEWWGAGVVICLDRGADLHTAQLMPLPLTVSCFRKIQIGFTFLVPAHLGSPGQRAVKWVYVCMYRVAQNKIPHWRICNISATNGLILKILEAA